MVKRFSQALSNFLLESAKKNKRVQGAIFLAILSPVILIAVFAYLETYRDLTQFTLSRRQSIAYLAATALRQRFDRLIDIGVSLATRVRFRQLVTEGKWEEAIEILKSVPEDFPFIDRVFLADPTGTLMADTPALPGIRGKNFAMRDWYRGVSNDWKPYISDAYQRAAEPRFNVVAAATPIRTEQQRVVGIMVLQVKLDELVGWSESIDIGPSGFVYFVDRKGQLATHPNLPSKGEIVSFSNLSVAQKVLRGRSGVETMFNPVENEEQIGAYSPVDGIG